ncbi:MAG: universal stress protein [Chloroflexia bacterium]|nr:universal stress protein [Chloroflexia bacterium]
MRPIVCATRGGEASRRTQQKAIDLAKKYNVSLIWLYVANPSVISPANEAMQRALEDELKRLGRALLSIAKSRAEAQGVQTEVTVLCCSDIPNTISDYLRQVDASMLVIGAPRAAGTTQVFGPEEIEGFAQVIQEESGVEVVLVT